MEIQFVPQIAAAPSKRGGGLLRGACLARVRRVGGGAHPSPHIDPSLPRPQAKEDVGAAFGKEFVDRAKKRFGIDLAVYSYDGKDFKKLSSTFGDGGVTRAAAWRVVARTGRFL